MAKAEKRLPWFKFKTRDWRASAKLRLCSFAARGLWIDLLSLMSEAAPRGFLLVEGVAPSPQQLTGLIGGSAAEIAKHLKELGATKVYSVTGQPMPDDVASLIPGDMPEGVILSRRMVRDEAKAARDKANGSGGGNPTLKGVNPPPNPQRSETRGHIPSHGDTSGDPPRASTPGGARAGAPSGTIDHDSDAQWRARLRTYRPGGFWLLNDWGPRPEDKGTRVPPHILAEWQRRQEARQENAA